MGDSERRAEGAGPVLLATKLRPPRTRPQTLLRAPLLGRLREGHDHAVTLVAGPAGFGKTTLLAAWHAAEAPRRPVGWDWFWLVLAFFRTVALEATLQAVASLGLLVLVRTFLTWTLVVEDEGRWPWQPRGPGGGEPARAGGLPGSVPA